MANGFVSFLDNIGAHLKAFFVKAQPVIQAVEGLAVAATPIVAAAAPGIAPLYTSVVTSVVNAENAAIAAGSQNGTGAQKLALVLSDPTVQAAFKTIESAAGVSPTTQAEQTTYINAVVATLNALPSALAKAGTPAS